MFLQEYLVVCGLKWCCNITPSSTRKCLKSTGSKRDMREIICLYLSNNSALVLCVQYSGIKYVLLSKYSSLYDGI